MSYQLQLDQFKGPFDLILFFIERDEVDIQDIPIAKITEDFLEYITQMQSLNIELASEFILVAASLMRIKAKMLLPRKEKDEEGNEIDPRAELVARLMEYKRFKDTQEAFRDLEEKRSQKHHRGFIQNEAMIIANKFSLEAELSSVTLYKLMKAFQGVLERYEEEKNKPKHTVITYDYTLDEQKEFVQNSVHQKEKVSFEDLFAPCKNRIHAIFIFLAILELVQLQTIHLQIGLGNNNFWLSRQVVEEN